MTYEIAYFIGVLVFGLFAYSFSVYDRRTGGLWKWSHAAGCIIFAFSWFVTVPVIAVILLDQWLIGEFEDE